MTELAILLITTALGIAGYFIHKWIEKVEKWIEVAATQRLEISETIGLVRSEQLAQRQSISKEINIKFNSLKLEAPKPANLDKIESELRGLSTTVNQKIIPALDKQEVNFGKIILIENSLQEYERKLSTMYQAVVQILQDRKKK